MKKFLGYLLLIGGMAGIFFIPFMWSMEDDDVIELMMVCFPMMGMGILLLILSWKNDEVEREKTNFR
jgi:hypothetical protein